MSDIASKRPTLELKWSVIGKSGERRLVPVTKKSKAVPAPESSEKEENRADNTIVVGEKLRLELKSDMDGYLSFFDFGTSGKLTRLFPCPQLSTVDNRIEAGKTYSAPGELLPIPAFLVFGPTTAESGRKERLLVIVTRNKVELTEAALLNAGARLAARGGFGAVEETVSSLLDLPDDEWTYGLLETEVV